MPDSRHHTIELALETEGMGCRELDKDRGVLSRACYFTGDLEDCETKNNKIQWIQGGTWSSIVPKRTSLSVDRARPYSTWQDSGDLELLQKHISQLGLLPGTKPSRYRAIHSADTQRKEINCTIKKLENPIDSLRGYCTQRLLRPAPCPYLLLAMQPKRRKKKKRNTC